MSKPDRAEPPPVPRLQVEGLTKVFRSGRGRRESTVAVRDATFHIDHGETYALVGASGAGKSTVARLVLRLETPTSGSIRIDGVDIAPLSRRALRPVRRKAQMIAQNPFDTFHPAMPVADLVAEPLVIHRIGTSAERHERVLQALADVALLPPAAFLGRFPAELSGGQRQRLAIARAIVLEPALLVADEPTSMLDASVQLEILAVLRGLREDRGLSTLLITHDLAAARYACDRVGVMNAGMIIEEGPVEQVIARPRQEYTRLLLDAASS